MHTNYKNLEKREGETEMNEISPRKMWGEIGAPIKWFDFEKNEKWLILKKMWNERVDRVTFP